MGIIPKMAPACQTLLLQHLVPACACPRPQLLVQCPPGYEAEALGRLVREQVHERNKSSSLPHLRLHEGDIAVVTAIGTEPANKDTV